MEGDSMPCKYQYDVTCSLKPSTTISTARRATCKPLPRPAQCRWTKQNHMEVTACPPQLNHALVNTFWEWINIGCAPHTSHTCGRRPCYQPCSQQDCVIRGSHSSHGVYFLVGNSAVRSLYVLDLININQLKGFVFVVSPPCWLSFACLTTRSPTHLHWHVSRRFVESQSLELFLLLLASSPNVQLFQALPFR